MKSNVISKLALVCLGLVPVAALAETTLCTVISALPETITTPGVYCLNSDFAYNSVSVNAITIAANNVTLDLNAHRIGNLAAGTAVSAYGVYAINQQNITVKNGTLRGFAAAVLLTDSAKPPASSQGHVVEDIRADQNRLVGIGVVGNGSIVRHNQVVATGGSTLAVNENSVGISVSGQGNRVLENDVTNSASAGTGNAFGIQGSGAEGLVVAGNRISGVSALGGGLEYAIEITSSPHAGVVENTLSNATIPASPAQSVGLNMDDVTDNFMGNLSIGFNTPYVGGTNAAGTNF